MEVVLGPGMRHYAMTWGRRMRHALMCDMEMRHTLTWNGAGYGNETYINMGMVLGMEMRHTLTWEWCWVWK